MKQDNKLTEKQARLIGTRINSALAGSNKLQKELAKHLNVTDNYVSYLCSGTRSPNIAQIIKIAEFTNVSADYLLGLSDVSSSDPEDRAICKKIGCSEEAYKALESIYSMPQVDDNPLNIIVSDIMITQKIAFDAFLIDNSLQTREETEVPHYRFIELLCDAIITKFLVLNYEKYKDNECKKSSFSEATEISNFAIINEYGLSRTIPDFIKRCAEIICKDYYVDFDDNWKIKDKITGRSIFSEESRFYQQNESIPFVFESVYRNCKNALKDSESLKEKLLNNVGDKNEESK